jgi:KaiC/GvpD/RAD55 family RecA-like ATPase
MCKEEVAVEVVALAIHPIEEFGTLNVGQNIAIIGDSGTGKSLLTFDVIVALASNDKKVLIIADEYDNGTVTDKILYSYLKQQRENVNNLTYEQSKKAKEEIASTLKLDNFGFYNSDILDSYVKLENIVKEFGYDAVVVDTAIKYTNDKVDYTSHLATLKELSDRNGTFTSYTAQTNIGYSEGTDLGVDKIFITHYLLSNMVVTELNSEGISTGISANLFK